MLVRITGIFLALSCLTAHVALAADIPSNLKANSLASIKSIGIISAVGDTLSIGTNGPLLRLSMTQKMVSISDLGIDDDLEAFTGRKLGANFKIETVQYDRTKFAAVQQPGFLQQVSLPPTQDLVKVSRSDADAYLVISKDLVPFGLSADTLRPGLNIGRGGFHENEYVADAFITVSVFDAHTNSLLAQVAYPPPISHFWGGQVKRLPLDSQIWPDDDGKFTQQQREELKKIFTTDLEAIVSESIENLGLLSARSQ